MWVRPYKWIIGGSFAYLNFGKKGENAINIRKRGVALPDNYVTGIDLEVSMPLF